MIKQFPPKKPSVHDLLEQGRAQGQFIDETVDLIARTYPRMTAAQIDAELLAYADELRQGAAEARLHADELERLNALVAPVLKSDPTRTVGEALEILSGQGNTEAAAYQERIKALHNR